MPSVPGARRDHDPAHSTRARAVLAGPCENPHSTAAFPRNKPGVRMRLFTASLATESNSFSPIPTNRASYEAAFYSRRASIRSPAPHHGAALRRAPPRQAGRVRAGRGLVLLGRAVGPDAAGRLRGACATRSSTSFRAAMPVDGVLLGLHGAMVAYGYDDCEGDLIERVRAIVGPKVVDRGRARPALPPDREARRGCPTS